MAFAVDFGTRSCVSAVCETGLKVALIHDQEYSKEVSITSDTKCFFECSELCPYQDTAALVSFAGSRRLVGESAESQVRSNITNTVVEITRLMEETEVTAYPLSRHTVNDGQIEVINEPPRCRVLIFSRRA